MLNSLKEELKKENLQSKILDIQLISAKTGYGVEKLINFLGKVWGTKGKFFAQSKKISVNRRKKKYIYLFILGDVYLVGCTNVGKSTLFNILLKSDLCRIEADNKLHRATISSWPGTTLNLLKVIYHFIYLFI